MSILTWLFDHRPNANQTNIDILLGSIEYLEKQIKDIESSDRPDWAKEVHIDSNNEEINIYKKQLLRLGWRVSDA